MSISLQAHALAGAEPILSSEELYRRGLEASLGDAESGGDLIAAHMWFNLASMQGHIEARAYRKELSLEMTSDEIAEAQRQARHYLLTTSVQASA